MPDDYEHKVVGSQRLPTTPNGSYRVSLLLNHTPKILIGARADPGAPAADGATPLHEGCALGDIPMCEVSRHTKVNI